VTTVEAARKPRLARGVRLRLDRLTGKTLLLKPERGFELQGSAIEVIQLCTAGLTVGDIVERLSQAHGDVSRDQLADDVSRLLGDLSRRGVIELEPP
jgi:pyrroloquinoline quinone biosynthesis protein D